MSSAKYMLNKINNSDINLGYYKITDDDKKIMDFARDKTYSLLLKKIYSSIESSSEKNTQEARNACGYPKDKLHSDEISKGRVFIVTDRALRGIVVTYKYSSITETSPTTIKKLQTIILYYNAMYNQLQTNIIITDTARTEKQQAKYIYNNIFAHYHSNTERMYNGYSGDYVLEEIQKGTDPDIIKSTLEERIKNGTYMGFNHIGDPKNTIDIGTRNSNPWATDRNFHNTLQLFIDKGIYLNTKSLLDGKSGEKDCHHLVFI